MSNRRSVAIEQLRTLYDGRQDIGIAYVYLRYSEKRRHLDILKAFIAQLVKRCKIAFALLKPKCEDSIEHFKTFTESNAIETMKELSSVLQKLFLLVDGVDEVDEKTKEDLLVSLPSFGCNILIASRPLELYQEFVPDTVPVKIQAHAEDIRLLVLERIQRSARLSAILRGKPDRVEQLCRTIISKSQGM